MPDISRITLPSGNTYDIKDTIARQMISGGVSFIICTAASNTPTAAGGSLAPADAQKGAFYLVSTSTDTSDYDYYDEYVVIEGGEGLDWEKIGDTQIDLSNVVTGVTLNKQTDKALGEATTFSVSKPTITVTPTTTNIKATASGTAVGANGTAAAVTGYPNTTTDTFVKSVSADTTKKLVTTTVPNVTGNTSVTANKSTWTFTMGTGDAAETLIIGGGNGSDVNATNTTLGTAKTVATGAATTAGTGAAVVTDITIGDSASALTGLGTPTTATTLTGVKVTTQPTVKLETSATSGTGIVGVATGITSATAGDQTITVGTNDKVTVLTDQTSITVTKGNQ